MFRCVCKRNNKVQPSKARSEWVRHPFDPRETKQETQSLFFFIKKAPTVPRLATIIDTFNLSALNCVHTQAHSKYTGNNAKFAAASLPDGAATFDDLWPVTPPPPQTHPLLRGSEHTNQCPLGGRQQATFCRFMLKCDILMTRNK